MREVYLTAGLWHRHDGGSFVGETLQKAVTAATTTYGQPPTLLLVLLPDTGKHPPSGTYFHRVVEQCPGSI